MRSLERSKQVKREPNKRTQVKNPNEDLINMMSEVEDLVSPAFWNLESTMERLDDPRVEAYSIWEGFWKLEEKEFRESLEVR